MGQTVPVSTTPVFPGESLGESLFIGILGAKQCAVVLGGWVDEGRAFIFAQGAVTSRISELFQTGEELVWKGDADYDENCALRPRPLPLLRHLSSSTSTIRYG
jgi:hypothetical protein